MTQATRPTALITGGTVGIGHAFAEALAVRGYDLVLASRDEAGLQQVAEQFRDVYGVNVEVIRTDLAVRADLLSLAERVESAHRPIDLLINNAGFGLKTDLLELDIDLHARALDVMCLAPLVLSSAAGRAMKRRGHGGIINVASSSAVITTGDYSAIKSYVQIMTEGLSIELEGTGVKVTALMPGWVKTEFHQRAGITAHRLPDFVWIPVDTLVAQALADWEEGKVLSVPTKPWSFAVHLARLVPRRTIRWVSKQLMSSRKKGTDA
ncbi:MAG: SDR family NAD(P)-dependent oxidoreductase [Propionibacteriaceae bacterium]|jgi:short-subunit dehydrogenase|nr:SDR family NAD(P)-dependent oxidoreductase [Propionibacteriaceae bacterium]